MNSTSCSWKKNSEDANKRVSPKFKKPMIASSSSFKDSSISLILTRNLMEMVKNTVSGNQNQKHALSCYGYTQSSHHCTTSLTKPAASEPDQPFPCSDHSLQLSELFSMEVQRGLDQIRSNKEYTSLAHHWDAWRVHSYFSEGVSYHHTPSPNSH